MTPKAGPQSPDKITAMIDEVGAEVGAAADPDWDARYGENLSSCPHYLFGV